MHITLLDESQFDGFAINHPNHNFYQSSNYGRFMSKHGYNSYYLGLVDSMNTIKAATLLIVKNEKNDKRKMGYAPRGFLIDWNNNELLKNFTDALKVYLEQRGFTYLKVDPMITYKEHDINGNEITSNESNLIQNLQALGYVHMGFNNGNEANKPRWNAITNLSSNIVELYNTLSSETKKKILEAISVGNKVYKGEHEDISLLHSIINKVNPPIEYYLDYYELFNQNSSFEIYFNKLEPYTYVNRSKKTYEEEEAKNHELNMQMQDFNNPNKENIINEKLKSDETLGIAKKKMIEAINLFQDYPNGIVTAAVAVVKFGKKVTFIATGTDESFKHQYPDYLLRWQLTEEFAKQGFEVIDNNGITGEFSDEYENLMKRETSNKIVEYVGEFDLVINKKAYYTGSKLNPIISWLNTPI